MPGSVARTSAGLLSRRCRPHAPLPVLGPKASCASGPRAMAFRRRSRSSSPRSLAPGHTFAPSAVDHADDFRSARRAKSAPWATTSPVSEIYLLKPQTEEVVICEAWSTRPIGNLTYSSGRVTLCKPRGGWPRLDIDQMPASHRVRGGMPAMRQPRDCSEKGGT